MADEKVEIQCPYCGTKGMTRMRPSFTTIAVCPKCGKEFTPREAIEAAPPPKLSPLHMRILKYAVAILTGIYTLGFVIDAASGKGARAEDFVPGLLALYILAAFTAAILAVFPLLGVYVAKQKGRSTTEGALFGLILGPFGILIVLLLPTMEGKK